ncbi:MAG: hypothetical protein HY075_07690 [Deltaproteobacteria bacterium]|nr:hypothetical protein [Deltaproteobacteria bacterium]
MWNSSRYSNAFVVLLACAGLAAAPAAKKKAAPLPQGAAAKAPSAPLATASPSPTPSAPATPSSAPSDVKPPLEQLLKPKSINKVVEDYDIITNSQWNDDDFAFVNAVLVRTPLDYARPQMMDFTLYPKMSSAIKKFDYDPATKTIEMIGETHGLRMHSWVKVDQQYWDVIRYTIVRGDMTGFKVDAYLWDKSGRTLAVAKGELPHAKQMLPTLVALVFKPVSEIVLGVATKNFRGYIEEEYKKQKAR